jgi:hypothetical protein
VLLDVCAVQGGGVPLQRDHLQVQEKIRDQFKVVYAGLLLVSAGKIRWEGGEGQERRVQQPHTHSSPPMKVVSFMQRRLCIGRQVPLLSTPNLLRQWFLPVVEKE